MAKLRLSQVFFNRMEAEKHAKSNGLKLASHRHLDEGIMRGKVRRVCFAREFVAYPASRGVFKKNEDIVDPVTGTRVPLSDLMRLLGGKYIYGPGIGLFIDPEGLDTHKKTGGIVVIPKSIVVLGNDETPFIQRGDDWVGGKPDKDTMIPLTGQVSDYLEQRFFRRVSQQGVRFLVRGGYSVRDFYGYGLDVYACLRSHFSGRVAFEVDAREAGTAASPGKLGIFQEGGKLVVEGTPEQLAAAKGALKGIQ